MAQRPQGFVGEAIVVSLFFFFGQPDAAQGVGGGFGRHGHAVLLVDHRPVGIAAAMGHPGSTAHAHHGIQGRGQAAGRPHAPDLVAIVHVQVGFAVGDHHHLQPAQPLADHVF